MEDNEHKRLVLPYNKGLSERICLLPAEHQEHLQILINPKLPHSCQESNTSGGTEVHGLLHATYVNVAQCTSGRQNDN